MLDFFKLGKMVEESSGFLEELPKQFEQWTAFLKHLTERTTEISAAILKIDMRLSRIELVLTDADIPMTVSPETVAENMRYAPGDPRQHNVVAVTFACVPPVVVECSPPHVTVEDKIAAELKPRGAQADLKRV